MVPVHDERERLPACLDALGRALAALPAGVRRHAVIVLDACRDDSPRIAAGWALGPDRSALAVEERNVGLARAHGARHALAALGGADLRSTWIATTDADSRVPENWLAKQLALADAGADAFAGTIAVDDWSEHPPAVARAFLRFYFPPGAGDHHDHVHGANLGVRADAYLAVGGFAGLSTGEDHALWNALRGAGRRLVASRHPAVVTSARRSARAPAGFSGFLRDVHAWELDGPESVAS